MSNGKNSYSLESVMNALRALYIAFIAAPLLYCSMSVFIATRGEGQATGSSLSLGIFAFAGMMVVVGFFVGRILLAKRVAAIQPPAAEEELGQAYFASKVLSWAMIEGGAILASTSILLFGNWKVGLQVAALALIALLMTRANRQDLEDLLRGAGG